MKLHNSKLFFMFVFINIYISFIHFFKCVDENLTEDSSSLNQLVAWCCPTWAKNMCVNPDSFSVTLLEFCHSTEMPWGPTHTTHKAYTPTHSQQVNYNWEWLLVGLENKVVVHQAQLSIITARVLLNHTVLRLLDSLTGLTHWGQVMHICVSNNLWQHWFR